MKKILNYLANKAMCAAFVVLGAASVSAEEVIKTPIIQTFDGVEESVGYTVSGLGEFKNEVAVVFTNHTKTATWTVPADLENVEFLVVGGGGGGGCCTSGPGGGGGGVVTGLVYSLNQGDSISVKVGGGGLGVGPQSTGGAQASKKGTNSWFKVNGDLYITANGGGAGGSVDGGSGAGGRAKNSGGNATQGTVDPFASDLVFAQPFGNKGGSGNSSSAFGGGGGGGAMEAGGDATQSQGGKGGAGLLLDITGVPTTYGSGGGGTSNASKAKQGASGDGAGIAGASTHAERCASPNQGGGGGGASSNSKSALKTGGNGGSGIVVFRYATSGGTVDFAQIEEVAAQEYPYTGENQLVLNETSAYTVSYQNDNVPNAVGEYVATITLKDGFVWADASEELSKTVVIKVVKSADEWVSEPSITKAAWSVGEAPGELTAPMTKFNADLQVVISKKDDSAVTFNSLDNLEAGDYVVTWTALGTDNYNAAEGAKTVEFTVVASDAVPPYTLTVGEPSVNDDRELSVSGSLSCEATTSKLAEIFAVYTIEGSGETNEVSLATQVALNGGDFTGIIPDLKPGATYSVAIYSLVGDEKSELTEFKTVTVLGEPKNLTAEATFTTTPDKKFVVTGSVTPGIGETKVTLYYSLNSTECTSTMERVVNDDGAFAFEISYENLTDNLSWYVMVANTFDTGTWQGFFEGAPTAKTTTERLESAGSCYVWTGNGGDNRWTNPGNWSCDNPSCYGYPGLMGNGYYYSWVKINSETDCKIDLEGGAYTFIDNGAFVVETGAKVEFYNGSLMILSDAVMNGDADNVIGTSGSQMVFNNVQLQDVTTLALNGGASVVFKGTTTQGWFYYPYAGAEATQFVVSDGTLTTKYSSNAKTPGSGSEVVISNGVWVVNGDAIQGLASVIKFRDGDNRQAQLQLQNVKLQGAYDIKLPEAPYSNPYVLANLLSANSTCTISIDATDYSGEALIPLMQFKGTLNDNTKNAMSTMTTDASKLIVKANGADVKVARNAKLVWDEEAKTLYFQQSSRMSIAPGDDSVTVEAENEADAKAQVDLKLTPPEGVDAKAYEAYFKLEASETYEGSGVWTVKAQLDEEVVKPVIAETTADDTTKEAFVIDADGNVTLNINNKKPGLYYGVQVLKELGADPVAVVPETEAGALVVTADNIPDGNAAFFRVVVDFAPIVVPEAE